MEIRASNDSDYHDVMSIIREAFGSNEEADLVSKLLADPSAEPYLSLLARDGSKAIGHILFTKARIESHPSVSASILAPLAVLPSEQSKGVGGKLIAHGLKSLAKAGINFVFVLGHPDYYPRHGFTPAGKHGFGSPHPILDKNHPAWMVQPLREGVLGKIHGKVICADMLNAPEYWSE